MNIFPIFAFCLLAAMTVLFAYRIGMADGMRRINGKEPAAVLSIKRGRAGAKNKPAKKYEQLLSNVEHYDGSAKGQVKI